jgi:hypothetical protein
MGIALAIGWDKEFRKSDGKRSEDEQIDLSVGITYALTGIIGMVAGIFRSLAAKEDGMPKPASGT